MRLTGERSPPPPPSPAGATATVYIDKAGARTLIPQPNQTGEKMTDHDVFALKGAWWGTDRSLCGARVALAVPTCAIPHLRAWDACTLGLAAMRSCAVTLPSPAPTPTRSPLLLHSAPTPQN